MNFKTNFEKSSKDGPTRPLTSEVCVERVFQCVGGEGEEEDLRTAATTG